MSVSEVADWHTSYAISVAVIHRATYAGVVNLSSNSTIAELCHEVARQAGT